MGFYIELPHAKRKAAQLRQLYPETVVLETPRFEQGDRVTICVVENGPFDAAGICFSQQELRDFAVPDSRPRTWLSMRVVDVIKQTGPYMHDFLAECGFTTTSPST